MTLTTHRVSPIVDKPGVDQRPGTSDIAWAERAYHHQRKEPSNQRRKGPRSPRHRLRILAGTITIVALMVGLVVAMRYTGSSPAPVTHQPTSSQTVTGLQPTTVTSPFTLTPPLVRPFPTLTPTIDTSKR
jgi:hypothetical protein